MTAREDLAARWTLAELLTEIEAHGWAVTAGPDDNPDGAYELRGTVLVQAGAGPDAPPTEVPTVLTIAAADLYLWWSAFLLGHHHGAQCERVALWELARRVAATPKRKRRKRR